MNRERSDNGSNAQISIKFELTYEKLAHYTEYLMTNFVNNALVGTFQTMVVHERDGLLSHPLCQNLLSQKW